MQAHYMIFWKTGSQLVCVLVDTEPFCLQVLHTSYRFVLLQPWRVSMAGMARPALWPKDSTVSEGDGQKGVHSHRKGTKCDYCRQLILFLERERQILSA